MIWGLIGQCCSFFEFAMVWSVEADIRFHIVCSPNGFVKLAFSEDSGMAIGLRNMLHDALL